MTCGHVDFITRTKVMKKSAECQKKSGTTESISQSWAKA